MLYDFASATSGTALFRGLLTNIIHGVLGRAISVLTQSLAITITLGQLSFELKRFSAALSGMASKASLGASDASSFEAAVQDFQNTLEEKEELDLNKFKTIDDVYEEINSIQAELGKKGQLRHMKKLAPLLACLDQYSSVFDTFVQVKPDVLALIWVSIIVQICPYRHGTD